ncbi:PIN domain-containing protein [Mycolicibacterium arseniciresistens]|uniref:PIN domain-containing protein n=1 Tax=Mycolicibacterium arseniciresistens TaxID=3062257 RepID=A0ABT8UER1_9MYCO|nr:PIN domain-containing protein [Mycolicibacterium arseniciresistens]MDO3634694.1 PIN domain-containing protein [Mycolicibacterium arseniciresistens]
MRVEASLVDTDAFSILYLRRNSDDHRVIGWREYLTGRRVAISFQTRAEVIAGIQMAGWGEQRVAKVRELLDQTPTIRSDDEVIDAYARLTARCRRAGHALHAKEHSGDRWVAACAIAKGLDLVAGDGIYLDAPDLTLAP